MYIVIEGTDGVGKTSFTLALVNKLKTLGIPTLHVREPGGTPMGEATRAIMLSNDWMLDDITQMLLVSASRMHLVKNTIIPALEAGMVVIGERSIDSTYAYQVHHNLNDSALVVVFLALEAKFRATINIDNILYLETDIEIIKERLKGRLEVDPLEADLNGIVSRKEGFEARIKQGNFNYTVLPSNVLEDREKNIQIAVDLIQGKRDD